jgi:SAM-dependent methyltransferase
VIVTPEPQVRYATMNETIKIINEGRLTKLPHVVRVRFAFINDSFFVLGGKLRSDWVLNALAAGKAKIRTQDFVFIASAAKAEDYEKANALRAFETKYGSRLVRAWYSNSEVCVRLTPERRPTMRGAVKGEGEATTTYREWLSHANDYYQSVAEAFDSASEEYDFTTSSNYINTWIRKRSIRELLSVAKQQDTIVEIGCGTGAEALEVSRHVEKVIATDISDSMIETVKKKVRAKQLSGKIVPFRVKAVEIGTVMQMLSGGKVQGAYSFNGALNCEPELNKFVEALSSIVVPGGYFVCSIRNPLCLSEAISHAAVLQFDKMAPRKKQPIMVSVGGVDVPAVYYPPASFSEIFSSRFRLLKRIGLPAFLPPAYLSDYYVKFKNVASVLERIELFLGGRFPFNMFGDQTLFVFQNLKG